MSGLVSYLLRLDLFPSRSSLDRHGVALWLFSVRGSSFISLISVRLIDASGIHIFVMFCEADLRFSYAPRDGHVSFYPLRDGPLFLMLHEADPCMTCAPLTITFTLRELIPYLEAFSSPCGLEGDNSLPQDACLISTFEGDDSIPRGKITFLHFVELIPSSRS